MTGLPGLVRAFADDESGATAIEYGLIGTLLAVSCIAAFLLFGGGLQGLFEFVSGRSGEALNRYL